MFLQVVRILALAQRWAKLIASLYYAFRSGRALLHTCFECWGACPTLVRATPQCRHLHGQAMLPPLLFEPAGMHQRIQFHWSVNGWLRMRVLGCQPPAASTILNRTEPDSVIRAQQVGGTRFEARLCSATTPASPFVFAVGQRWTERADGFLFLLGK